jgi:hypothetical protein
MNTKLGIILAFYISNIMMCQTKYSYNNFDVNHAIEYLQGYTGMPMREVLFLSSPWFSVDQETFVEEYSLSLSKQSIDRYIAYMTIAENTRNLIFKAIQSTSASEVIFSDFEKSADVQKAFLDLPDQATKDNTFLILLSTDFRSLDDMFAYAFKLISTNPEYVLKFSLNSHVFAIARVKNSTRLIEIYQRCNNDPIQ